MYKYVLKRNPFTYLTRFALNLARDKKASTACLCLKKSVLSVSYHPSDGVIKVISVMYHPSNGVLSVLSVNYQPSDGVVSVLSVNYQPSNEVLSDLGVDYYPFGRVIVLNHNCAFPPVASAPAEGTQYASANFNLLHI